jgi:hypothetical protein
MLIIFTFTFFCDRQKDLVNVGYMYLHVQASLPLGKINFEYGLHISTGMYKSACEKSILNVGSSCTYMCKSACNVSTCIMPACQQQGGENPF